jgi:LPXTG-motif cell wall-anchored protein
MTRPTSRRAGTGLVIAGLLVVSVASVTPSGATQLNPTPYEGNLECSDVGLFGFTINTQPSSTVYTTASAAVETEGAVPADLWIAISDLVINPQDKTVTFNWSATTSDGSDTGDERDAFHLDTVFVKYANGGLRWDYDQPGETFDTAWAAQDSISHVRFCFDNPTSGTTTTTEATTTTTEATTTTTEGTTTTRPGSTSTSIAGGGTSTTNSPGGASVLDASATRAEQGALGAGGAHGNAATRNLPRTGSDMTLVVLAGALLTALGLALIARRRDVP